MVSNSELSLLWGQLKGYYGENSNVEFRYLNVTDTFVCKIWDIVLIIGRFLVADIYIKSHFYGKVEFSTLNELEKFIDITILYYNSDSENELQISELLRFIRYKTG